MPTEKEIEDLAEAMWQLLDDMGKDGRSVCLAAKAQARIAYEPFNIPNMNWADWMSLADAEQIQRDSDQ